MLIGSKSTDTLFDVFRTGISETIREVGLPEEVSYTTRGCELISRAMDYTKRVDSLFVKFTVKEGTDPNAIMAAMENTRIGGRVRMDDVLCTIQVPPFEWRQLQQLAPIHQMVNTFAAQTISSQSWRVEVIQFVKHDQNINLMIEQMKDSRGSDLHLRAGSPPYIRVDNDLVPLDAPVISASDMEEFALQVGDESVMEQLRAEREFSWQFHAAGVGYLRVSGYYKQGAPAIALRLIPEEPIPFEKLDIPMVVRNIADARRGLFLVCGITGSGKSTTLASMVDYINSKRHAHVITVEDPIEFVYRDKKSIISQRQVGRDTFSFANALRGALREDPDVILVGEMRDMETIRAAVSAAETGHLVFSTLHTMTAVDTVNRVISYFPQAERELIRQELAYSLKGVVCQRLLKRKTGGRIPCVEILLGGKPIVRDAILEGEIGKLHNILEVDSEMKTFDQHAVELYQAGVVTKEEAISACSNEEGFERIISGIKSSEGRKLLK